MHIGPLVGRFLSPTVWFAATAVLCAIHLTEWSATLDLSDATATQAFDMTLVAYEKIKETLKLSNYYTLHAVIIQQQDKQQDKPLRCMVAHIVPISDPNEITYSGLAAVSEYLLWSNSVKRSTVLTDLDTRVLDTHTPVLSIRKSATYFSFDD